MDYQSQYFVLEGVGMKSSQESSAISKFVDFTWRVVGRGEVGGAWNRYVTRGSQELRRERKCIRGRKRPAGSKAK